MQRDERGRWLGAVRAGALLGRRALVPRKALRGARSTPTASPGAAAEPCEVRRISVPWPK